MSSSEYDSTDVVAGAGFNVRDYARTAVGSHRGELNLDEFAERPLSPGALRVLRYIVTIERATMGHLRNVLVTATHKDARVTAFLGTWAFEKFWIADAFETIVEAHGDDAPPVTEHRMSFVDRVKDRFGPITRSIVANKHGVDMVAVHMAMGTVDEWLSQSALGRLAAIEPHPELVRVIERIVAIKSRQLEFFEAQARDRLAASIRTQQVVKAQLKRMSWPVGVSAEPAAETAFFFDFLYGKAQAAVAAIDERVDALPGLAGLDLVSHSAPRLKALPA